VWDHSGKRIPIEVRALDAEGQFLPVSAPGADAKLQLSFSFSPYGPGSSKAYTFQMVERDSLNLSAGGIEDFAASVASIVSHNVAARGLEVTPTDARIARICRPKDSTTTDLGLGFL
jgi:hypothetical protein